MMEPKLGFYERYMKRILDVVIAFIVITVFSPLLLLTALLVRIKLGSPIIFCQERPGKIDTRTGKEKIFRMYKFRSMTNERTKDGNLLPDNKRLTAFGKTLRASSIDELLELINVVKGDMSLVGPRPLLIKYLPYYTEKERIRHTVRPGLTGLAQISGRNAITWDDRLSLDVKYVENITFIGDVKIIFKTITKVIKKENVIDAGNFKMLDLDQERERSYAINKNN